MKQTQEIAFAQAAADLVASEIEWVSFKDDKREVWRRGNAGEDLSESDRESYNDLIQTAQRIAYFQYRMFQSVGSAGHEIPAINLATLLHRNPGARREWSQIMEDAAKYREPLISDDRRAERASNDDRFDRAVLDNLAMLDELYGASGE